MHATSLTRAFFFVLAVTFPAHQGLVTDTASMLTPSQRDELAAALRSYQERSTNVIAILTVPTLDGLSVEEYANRVFHEWGIGSKDQDNGVLLLWAIQERKVRIEVGYGLEASLPDGHAGQIIREEITPYFRQQRWVDGLRAGTQAIMAQLDRQPAVPMRQPGRSWAPVIVGLLGLGAAGILVAVLLVRRARRRRTAAEFRHPYEKGRTYVWPSTDADAYVPRHTTKRSASTSATPTTSSWSSGRSRPAESPTSSSSWSDSSSSSSGSSDSGSFGGGDSGGGGASGSY